MRHYEHLQWGSDRLRLSPWRGDPTIAELTPALAGRPVAEASIRRGLELVAGRGYRGVLTNALAPEEQRGYISAGFHVHERLHLLSRSLDTLPDLDRSIRLRRGRRRDRPAIFQIDHAAFELFWRLDELGLHEALNATPSSRLRVNTSGPVVGYAITGRAGTRGYLQRLAVDPEHHGHGLGTTLVLDALHWLRRRGVHTAVVNTQEANDVAMRVYCRVGFAPQPEGLAVLGYQFESA